VKQSKYIVKLVCKKWQEIAVEELVEHRIAQRMKQIYEKTVYRQADTSEFSLKTLAYWQKHKP